MRSPRSRKTDADGLCEDNDDQVGKLYERYAPSVAAYALRRTSRADAADVVAETFLVAWRRRDLIPSEPMALPWLYGVARRVLANQNRSRYRRSRLHDRLATQFTQHHAPSTRFELSEGFERLGAALKKLSEDDAEVLRLTAWEDLSPTEIASVLDIAPDAVRQRLHRARKRLRKQLAVEEPTHRPAKSSTRTHAPVHGSVIGLGGHRG